MSADTIREASKRPVRSRTPGEVVERLRIWLPLAIFLAVVAHQAWEAVSSNSWSTSQRFFLGMLFYGIVGPATTFWTLDWIARAIAMRESIETRARRGERYLASITSSSASAIFSLDNAGIIQSWNRGAQEIFGFPPDEIVGQSMEQLLPEGQDASHDEEIVRMELASQGFIRGHTTIRRTREGREVHVDLTQTLLKGEHNRVVGSSVILRDVSDRVAAEEVVRNMNRELELRVTERTQQLEEATEALQLKNQELVAVNDDLKQLDALKDEFVDLVSHELRAPLTNINASVELLLSQITESRQKTKLEIIGHEASRLTRLVQSVLDVSRMEAGRLDILAAPIDVSTLCHDAAETLELRGDHEWHIEVEPGTPAVMADPDRAVQVLSNLLSNAAKYSPVGSRIEVHAGPAPDPRDSKILFSISDTGVGIPSEELNKIFDRFHRVERGDARETYGHGLGLYIASKIIEAHGGRIWVKSIPNEGSTFLFTLPSTSEEA